MLTSHLNKVKGVICRLSSRWPRLLTWMYDHSRLRALFQVLLKLAMLLGRGLQSEMNPEIVFTINLSLPCFWDMQPRLGSPYLTITHTTLRSWTSKVTQIEKEDTCFIMFFSFLVPSKHANADCLYRGVYLLFKTEHLVKKGKEVLWSWNRSACMCSSYVFI